ncbi:MAG: NAD(P)-dependent oxidoreductase [Dehalococcoidia bacterium]|nr:NAD(P)-dependent oxidoreductase [Dehalococcoidia bacterium]
MAGPWQAGEIVHADILDLNAVHEATEGMDGVVHLAVCYAREQANDDRPFLVNLKGLWNVLEASRQCGVRRVVHVGSCCTVHPKGIFFTSEVRSAEGDLYGVCKRLQEEMCRQYHAAHGLGIVVLRPDYIVDSRLGVGRHRERLGSPEHPYRNGWVCRHDLAEACRLALEHETIDFDVFHIVGTPEADETCNVARSREILGLTYRGNLQQYR